ncbi:uncharacterized protein LOC113760055 [Coffea eugenioides]|uniref:uncharacterized protein LOC113760055 n=1 Tax=Coffea eugenioides TaxID=49369 RepID=UPI000F61485A|nr:uncharacterized protein LOC113760055 [Coffea eugenioides]
MAEKLEDAIRKFALSDKELESTDLGGEELDGGIQECQLSLVGRIKGEKVVNFVGVKNFVNSAWGYPRNLRIIELGPNIFQFYVPNKEDRDRIVGGGPWVMDNQMLVMKHWFEGIEEDISAFDLAPLWVQVWNLPVHWITKEAGWKIGYVFQEVKDVLVPQVGGKEGRHLKLLAVLDTSLPLLRGSTVKVNGALKWLNFRYERCPEFCYKCGVIGHGEKSCKEVIQICKGKQEHQYGPWLRANTGKSSPQKEQQNRYNSEKNHWGFKDGEMVLLNPKEKGNMKYSQKDFMPGRKEVNRKGNEEEQTSREKSKEVGGDEVQQQRVEDNCSIEKMYSFNSNSSKSQKESCSREASKILIGGKSNSVLEEGRMSISEEVENHGKNKGEVERNGLEQIAQELMQVTVVEEDSSRLETALMQIDPGSSDVGSKAA